MHTVTHRSRSHRTRLLMLAPKWSPARNLSSLDLWLQPIQEKVSTGGSRLYASANSEYHSRADNAAFDLSTGDFLFAFHIYRNASAAEAVLSKVQGGSDYYKITIDSSDKVDFISVVGGATKIRIQGNTALSSSAWHHVVVLCDRSATGGCKVYLNGSDDTAGTPTTSTDDISNSGAFEVGRDGGSVYANSRLARVCKGSVSDVTGITATAVSSLYNSASGATWADLSVAQRTDYGFTSTNGVFYIGNEASGTLTDSVGSLDLADNNSVTTATGPASNGGVAADGDPIMQLTDRSSNAKVFAQTSRAAQPVWNANDSAMNNMPSITFDGSDDLLKLSSSYLSGTEGVLWAVIYPTSFSGNPRVISSSDEGTSSSRLDFSCKASGNQFRVRQVSSNDTADDIRGSTTLSTSTLYIIIVRSDGSDYFMRINGADETITVSAGANSGDWFGDTAIRDNVVLGALQHTGTGQYFVGRIGEWGVCSAANTGEIPRLEAYLSDRYGVVLP